MSKTTKPKTRTAIPMQITMPPDERVRLSNFCRAINSPVSWIVRDAIRAYLDVTEPMQDEMIKRRQAVTFQDINPGQVPEMRQGRPPNV
jgi:predicted transcriptional regulator